MDKGPSSQSYGFSCSHVGCVQFSHSVMCDSLRPHELQHARPPCPSPTSGVHPNPCPLSRWCHPTISSSVVPFSSCLQSFPASGSFQMDQLFIPVAKVFEFQLQHQSFQWIFRTGRDCGQEKATTDNEMAGWHHGLDGREAEWTLRVGDGQGGLACCNSCRRKELDTTERLNLTEC